MPFANRGDEGGRVLVEPLPDGEKWRLAETLVYKGDRQTFIVPAGFVTDFATVPRVVVWLVPKFGKFTKAAILHDWLIDYGIPAGLITSTDTDGVFRRAMRELDVPPVRRWLMWTGVRWGALFNKRRRAGWTETAVPVLALSVLPALAFALPVAFVAAGLVLYGAAEFLVTLPMRRRTSAGSLST